jgi:Cell wall-active antibiotics response 4TMS YvqF/Domain of unknown function (DUF1707)
MTKRTPRIVAILAPMDRPGLVLVRDRREAVIQQLTDGFAHDLIDLPTFEERISLAHQAATVAQLDELVADLQPLPAGASSTALVKLEADPALEAQRPDRRRQLIVFGSSERRGAWVVPRQLRTVSVFGSAVLDFRQAQLGPGVTTVHVNAVFGNVEIIVPPQLAVESEGHAVFGAFEDHASAVADPDRPVLRIVGTAVFGNVEISMRLPGESEHQARKRERKALKDAARPALPPRSTD